jgi:hypothetical protein
VLRGPYAVVSARIGRCGGEPLPTRGSEKPSAGCVRWFVKKADGLTHFDTKLIRSDKSTGDTAAKL